MLSKMKFHVTVGHVTAMATAEFFGDVSEAGAAREDSSASPGMMDRDTINTSLRHSLEVVPPTTTFGPNFH